MIIGTILRGCLVLSLCVPAGAMVPGDAVAAGARGPKPAFNQAAKPPPRVSFNKAAKAPLRSKFAASASGRKASVSASRKKVPPATRQRIAKMHKRLDKLKGELRSMRGGGGHQPGPQLVLQPGRGWSGTGQVNREAFQSRQANTHRQEMARVKQRATRKREIAEVKLKLRQMQRQLKTQ